MWALIIDNNNDDTKLQEVNMYQFKQIIWNADIPCRLLIYRVRCFHFFGNLMSTAIIGNGLFAQTPLHVGTLSMNNTITKSTCSSTRAEWKRIFHFQMFIQYYKYKYAGIRNRLVRGSQLHRSNHPLQKYFPRLMNLYQKDRPSL